MTWTAVSGAKQRAEVQTNRGTVTAGVISTAENHPAVDALQAAFGHVPGVPN